MAEYIEREALIEKISKLEAAGAFTEALKNATLKTISKEPAADVQEVGGENNLRDEFICSDVECFTDVRIHNDDYCSKWSERSEYE